MEWVVEEDARRILLSSPSGAGCERSIIGSCQSDGTRPGARDVAFPSSRSQLGMRAGDDGRRRRWSDSTRPGARDVAFPSSLSQLGMRAGDADDETRGYERDEPLRSVLGRADPEQGPP